MKWLAMSTTCVVLVFAMAFVLQEYESPEAGDSVAETLFALGAPKPSHYVGKVDQALAKMGEEMVKTGRTTGPTGKKSKYISRYYVCTSCHNIEREDANLTAFDPEERLEYVSAKGIPMLQATTFWGMVNRESWYNDDYYKKYGEAVEKANHDLREAIQLCAVECSQGRRLENWEVEALLHYYWTLELKIQDLDLDEDVLKATGNALIINKVNNELVDQIKSSYALKSPATFSYPPAEKFEGYGLKGNPASGKKVYENSCLHCHQPGGVSDFTLDDSKYSFKFLNKYMLSEGQLSFYEVVRRGTYSWPGSRPYMPHYSKEKMSDQQVEDLRSYIQQRVSGD